ncbi:hypothetical protein A7A09_019855 [Paracoccus methylarcula]|uniref:Transcriptional regulator n=1 Tax=Paracoccus methylarcula TaxID=72022 RepID=A0A422QST5_9RHOB|nr:hypothetical protein A7A09_019855 [Paracoccus methylarcula]
MFKPKETIHDRTTAAAKQIVADAHERQVELGAQLKAARLKKEAAEATRPALDKRKSRKGSKR